MSIKSAVAIFAFAALATPAFADIPDGHGGRTSLQASPHKTTQAPHACCCPSSTEKAARKTPASPAEVKAIGEVAWAARAKGAGDEAVACYKRVSTAAPVYASSAELKAVGHLGRKNAATPTASMTCCESQACPMRKAS